MCSGSFRSNRTDTQYKKRNSENRVKRHCSKLELQFEIELSAARRIGGNRLAEERRAENGDIGNVVGMVEDIERVERDGECRDVVLVFAMLR